MHSEIEIYFRGNGSRKVFPVTGPDGENSIQQLGSRIAERKNPNAYRVYSADGLSPCLGTMQGGGREPSIGIKVIANYPSGNEKSRILDVNGISRTLTASDYKQPLSVGLKIGLPCFIDMNCGAEIKLTENARTLKARYNAGVTNRSGDNSGVAIPVLTPDRADKRQNGRRFKENGEPMFTLTGQDIHGVAFKVKEATKQGYSEAYEGDSINLSMPESKTRRGRVGHQIAQILDTSCNQGTPIILTSDAPDLTDKNNGIYVETPEGFSVYAIWYEKEQCYIAIRKLTPKECFRLQGWADDYFERAAFVNSDSQLYKQAGNGVTVSVIKAIGEKLNDEENN